MAPHKVAGFTTWAESRKGPLAQLDVLSTIYNRVADPRWPADAKGVCLQRWQFSCWVPAGGPQNYQRLEDAVEHYVETKHYTPQLVEDCALLALAFEHGLLKPIHSGNHYHATRLDPLPSWAVGVAPLLDRRGHKVYRL